MLREQYRQVLQAYSEKIRPYLEVEVDNLKGTVHLHEPRWIAEGSGDITWANGSNTRFCLSEGRIEPFDELLVLQEHLTALLELKHERDKALEKISVTPLSPRSLAGKKGVKNVGTPASTLPLMK